SEQRYRLLAETARDAILVYDLRGRITYANQAAFALTGYSWEELLDRPICDLFPLKLLESEENQERSPRDEDQDHQLEETDLVTCNNLQIPVELSSAQISRDGNVTGVLLVVRDIRERRRAESERGRLEEQLLQTQKMESIGILAGGIAHDFNNLLMAILGNVSLATQDISNVNSVRESLSSVRSAAQRAADLTRQLLAYSGKGKMIVERVCLGETVHRMTQLINVSVSKKAAVIYRISQDDRPVEADASQIRQLVLNLVMNASESLGNQTGTITITTGAERCSECTLRESYFDDDLREGDYAFIEIQDTGCGMDRETLSRVFDPFFTTKFTGRGLGLAAVSGIVRSHRGVLLVISNPGEGSLFKVLFPVVGSPGDLPSLRDGQAIIQSQGKGTVLMVDDEEQIRTVVGKMIEKMGFTVVFATNGREAVEVFRAKATELAFVLLDLTMPEMSGEEVLAELNKIRHDVKVIATSGVSEQMARSRFEGMNLAGFIQKPYEYSELVSKIHSVVGKDS
ncbi:MAG TPA: PAS domain S-box protein, partial [bacterium]|nr:PAS domain S-box protein [bacterium]